MGENLDQVIARMGIWQISDRNHAMILPALQCDPEYAAFVICLDFDELHSTMDNLKKWLEAYEQVSTELLLKMQLFQNLILWMRKRKNQKRRRKFPCWQRKEKKRRKKKKK